jgi:hypothetical protein
MEGRKRVGAGDLELDEVRSGQTLATTTFTRPVE